MPWGDWQFWLVTIASFGAILLLLRPFLIRTLSPRGRKHSKRANLTLEGRQVDQSRRSSRHD
ncbi:MAG: hypothetical protein GY894_08140 [Planctomycetes bacterium]|nr:hypothetical protein [Planctomycetota bacterium]MCP4839316.1 hypothetical protein [Planctomycetota bacterium]